MIGKNRAIFEAVASSYLREDEHWGDDLDVLAEAIRSFLPDVRYVDLGCGPGFHVTTIARRFPEVSVTGVDYSPAMLAEAEREILLFSIQNVSLLRANILEFKPACTYHVASCLNNTLGNLYMCGKSPAMAREKAMRAIRALLVQDGQLVASVYNLGKFSARYGENLRVLPQSDPKCGDMFIEWTSPKKKPVKFYSHWFTENELRGLLEQNGFKVDFLEKRMARLVVRARAV